MRKKLAMLMASLFLVLGTAWAEDFKITGLTVIPEKSIAPSAIETGYYLLKEVNPNASGKPGGFMKATSEANDAVVTPQGRNNALVATNVDATYIWYIEKADDGTFTISTANKVAAWQAPYQRQKNLVAYANKGNLKFVTESITLDNQTAKAKDGAFIVQDKDNTSCVHYSDQNLGSWTDANPASVMMFEAYSISKDNLITNFSLFKYAASFEEVESKNYWCYLKFDSKNKFYLRHTEGSGPIALNSKAVEANYEDYYLWGFVGNPFDGFKIVNRATGTTKVLSSSTTMSGKEGSGTYPIMTTTPVPQGNNELWIPTSSDHAEGGFYLGQKGYPNNRMNNRDAKLAYWTGGADAGSTFKAVTPFNPEKGKMYALKENSTGLFLDIQTLGIHESGHTTNSFSLNTNPCVIYFEAGTTAGTWKMKNVNGTYASNVTSGRDWNTTISSTSYDWIISTENILGITIAKNASNYIGWDKNKEIVAGSALYNNAEGGNDKAARLYFTLVEYTSADLAPQGYYSLKLKDENNTLYLNFTEIGDTKATLQDTPTYFHLLPSANKNYLIFQNKNNADQYLGHPAGRWETTYDCKLWQISEADEDGKVLISRHADVGSDGGKNFGTNESIEKDRRLYTNVKDNCKRWLIEGVFDCPTNGTVKNGNYEFKSAPIRYLNACNKIRFTLTESGAFFQNGAKRMSLDEFVLYDAEGKKVELTAKNVTGNNNKTYDGMFDGVNDKFAGTATWSDGTEDDYFEILLPKGVDLGGAFSFSFVTENTTMNSKAFKIETSYQKINSIVYTFVVNAPKGHSANATYNGSEIADDQTFEEDDFDVELFAADEISGYTWKVVVDDENATITLVYTKAPIVTNPEAVVALVKRIGGDSAADKFKFVLDPSINSKQETFVLGAEGELILIKGTTISAITTGIGWYLNNIAHINIAWNSLNEKTVSGDAYADLSNLPLPSQTETHTSDAKYRYYLNYCTFGYSMTSWTWKRWQQEIDWMALHGINMPLQIVGLEEVWRKFLTLKDANGNSKYNYTDEDAMAFVAGPAYTAWWGMNNLQGWGGTGEGGNGGVQDPKWYERQAKFAKQITDLQRALGMQPVLPGFSGMVPIDFDSKAKLTTISTGSWNSFTRPDIVSPTADRFAEIAADYYACLKEVMGESQYYSMDPFHEGAGNLASREAYEKIYDAMEAAKPGSQWVIQQWQWDNGNQKLSLQGVPAGKLIVLDLFSDGKPEFDAYDYNGYAPQDAVFCALPNFGGRSGLMGRLNTIVKNYFEYKAKYSTIKGIGTTPEAIEQTPVTYDLVYQLPWVGGSLDVAEWVANYAVARYGKDNAVVKEAWEQLRQGPLNYGRDNIQGPVEDVWAARPNLNANPASYWGKTLNNAGGTYTPARRQMLIDAVYKLIDQEDELELTNGSVYKSNYMYDLVEFGGGVMADYAYDLLKGIAEAKKAGNTELFNARKAAFLQLILDVDDFKGTNLNFRLGKWTQEARDAAVEAKNMGATIADEDWYEFNNARTILTTWGDWAQANNSRLRDYSYRSWQGLMKDVYYKRWEHYFANDCTYPNGNVNNYFYFEWNWAHGMTHAVGDTQKSTTRLTEGAAGYSYTREPENTNTVEKAVEMLGKYIIPIKYNDGTTYYAYRTFATDLADKVTINVVSGATIDFAAYFGITNAVGTIKGDFVSGGSANMSQAVINAAEGTYTATITLTDGTELKNLIVKVEKAAINAGYYHIKYNDQPLFIGYNEENDDWEGDDHKGYKILGGAYTTDAEADKVFAIVPNVNGYSIAAQGKYLKAIEFNAWRHIQFSDNKDEAGKYVFHEVADIANAFKIQGVGENDGTGGPNDYMQVYNTDGAMIVGPNPVGVASSFALTPATSYAINVPENGYLPLYLPFNVVLPEGVEACDINDLSKEKLMMGSEGLFTTIATAGQIVQAGTPVIVKAAPGAHTLAITVDSEGAKTSLAGSVLRGNYVKQTLARQDGYKRFVFNGEGWEMIENEREISANSCWIELETEYIFRINAPEGVTISAKYNGNDVVDGGTIQGSFDRDLLTDTNIDGYICKVEVDETAGTITLTYTERVVEEEKTLNGYYYISYENNPVFIGYNTHKDDDGSNEGPADVTGYKMIAAGVYNAEVEADKVFAILPKGDGYTISAQGKYLQSPNFTWWNHVMFSDDPANAGVYKLYRKEEQFNIQGVNENAGEGGAYKDYLQVYASSIVANNSLLDYATGEILASDFTLTPVETYTLTIPNAGFLGVCLPFNVILPEGVTAWDINELSEEKLDLGFDLLAQLAKSGDILKAGTPAILRATSGSYDFALTLRDEDAKTSLEGSVLRGSFVKTILRYNSAFNSFVLNGDMFEMITRRKEVPANSCWIETAAVNEDIELDPDYITIGNWEFRVKRSGKGIILADCVKSDSNDGVLVIESLYEVDGIMKEVVGLSDDFLYDNKDITSITLPATLTSLGSVHTEYMCDVSYSGVSIPESDVDQWAYINQSNSDWWGRVHELRYNVLGNVPWRMTMDVTLESPDINFNTYGSCLLSTKPEVIQDNYTGGDMQLYLQNVRDDDKDGVMNDYRLLVFKLDSQYDTHYFHIPANSTSFTFILENNGAGGYILKTIYEDGSQEYFALEAKDEAEIRDIKILYSAMPTGMDVEVTFEELINTGLFVGCSNLCEFKVAEGNENFTACEHGVLYNADKTYVLRFPEGGGHDTDGDNRPEFETPREVTRVRHGALHDVNADIYFHSNPQIMYVKGHEEHMIATYHLVIDDDAQVKDFVSANENTFETIRYWRNVTFGNDESGNKKSSEYGTIMLPFVPDEDCLKDYRFYRFKEGDSKSLTFSQVKQLEADVPYLYEITKEYVEFTKTEEETTIKHVWNYTSEVEHESGEWKSVGTYSTKSIVTNGEGEKSYYYAINADYDFVRAKKTLKTKPYRAYYLLTPNNPNATAPAKLTLRMADGTTTEIDASQVEGLVAPEYYDLMGRRVLNPENGIYIVNGRKVLVK